LKSLSINKENFETNFAIAGCFQELGNFTKAIEHYQYCTRINPNKSQPFHFLGVCFKNIGNYQEALYHLNKSNKIYLNASSLTSIGNTYLEMGNFLEAKKYFKKAIVIDDTFVRAKISLINVEVHLQQNDDAEKNINDLIKDKNSNQNFKNRATILLGILRMSSGNYNFAVDIFESVLKTDRDNIEAKFNLSLAYLFLKNFEIGWALHESRINMPIKNMALTRQTFKNLSKPKWDPSKPKRNILIWGEAGIGDQILYSQFLEIIKINFDNIILAVTEKLIPFFQNIYPSLKIIDYKKINEFHNWDYHLPLGSLGIYFQKDIQKNTFKNKVDYKTNHLSLPEKLMKLRVGLSWKSKNNLIGDKKSIDLIQLKNLFSFHDIEFVNLQYSNEEEEITILENLLGKKIFLHHNNDNYNNISGVAEIIDSCDLVVTVSNTNAHIAGKLGVKTFLLLPHSDGKLWYWGTQNDKEILWYPSVTPFRQADNSNWSSCIDDVVNEIKYMLKIDTI
jgi:tetratricopeptide (TPR) repeat protein